MATDSTTRNPNRLAVFLGIGAVLVAIPVVFVGFLGAEKAPDEVANRRAAERLANRTKLDEAAEKQLTTFGWVDKAKGTVHLPISDAIALTVRDLAVKKPMASAVKVDAILPMPVVDPKSTEPAPSALPSSPQGADTVRFLPSTTPAAVAVPPVAPTNPSPANPAPTK
ncbi:MAG: hypothetical protein WCI46_08080 [Verrucomicrobiota bacterium]